MEIRSNDRIAVWFAALMVASMVAMPALTGASTQATTEQRHSIDAQAAAGGAATLVQPGGGGPPGQSDGPPGQSDAPGSGGGGPPGHERGSGATEVTVPERAGNSSVETILLVRERVGTLRASDDETVAAHAADAVAAMNATLETYRQVDRIDSAAAFQHVTEAQEHLAALAEALAAADAENQTADADTVVDASADLHAAVNASARIAVRDAGGVVLQYEPEFRNRGQRQSAESALGNALDALGRADERAAGESDGVAAVDRRADAAEQFRTAWEHAERALDVAEANSNPRLSLSRGPAFAHNDSVIVPVEAGIGDVRPYAFENATVDADAGQAEPIALTGPGVPGGYATGSTFLEVGTGVENVTVTVSATAAHDEERTVERTIDVQIDEDDVVPERPDPDEYAEASVTEDSSGVTVDIAGEGVWEGSVSVTDETPATDREYRAGPTVRIENRTDFEEATVEIPIDEVDLEREDGNLSVVTWDPNGDGGWTTVETEVDREAGVARATVDHFSFFSVFWIEDWEDHTADTVTLEDEDVVGNVTANGSSSDILKADFAFVIDVSGSMSGGNIHYARLAAQRFVGAFRDDERGALATFSSGSSLRHGLTRDHDSLNSTISSLGTGGGTNTGSGLQTGMRELQSEGWENRSSVMILLADGGTNAGPNPVSVAETAAEHDIEISTVGVGGGIDERELRAIAGAADGDYYHVQSAEDLPDTFERVAEEQGGVELVDSDGDGIPNAVEEMDLTMPTGEPGVVGEPLNLDPTERDTSGDGRLDNETVDLDYRVYEEDNETKLTASVTYAESHPARVDTTGDGLIDEEQREGWEIQYTTSPEETKEFLGDLHDAEDLSELGDPEEYFESEEVTANPLVSDTNGDGLSDLEERRWGTHPRRADTTGDGIVDEDAEAYGGDPTLYDARGPEITIYQSYWHKPAFSFTTEYNLNFRVYDPATVATAEVQLDGDIQDHYDIYERQSQNISEFDTGAFTTITDIYGGTHVEVEATDANDNTASKLAIQRHDIFGEAAARLAEEGVVGQQQIHDLGLLSGLSTGAVETAEFIEAFLSDPVGFVAGIADVIAAIPDLPEIIAALPEAIESQQDRNNPHDEDDEEELYDTYRQGWYEGYVGYFVLESLLPAGELGRALQSSNRLQNTVSALDRGGDLAKAARYAGQARHAAGAPVRLTGQQLSRGVQASVRLGEEAAQRTVTGAQTAVQRYWVAQRLRHFDPRTIERLSPDQQRNAGSTLARSSDDAARVMADGGGEVWRVHRLDLDVDTDALASNIAEMSRHTDVDAEQVVDDLETLKRADDDIDGLDELARNLKVRDTSNFRGHAQEARVAAGFVRNSDRTVTKVSQRVSTRDGSTEIDIGFEDGSTVEVKSGDLAGAGDIDQLRTQLRYRSENGQGGNHYVAVSGEIGDQAQNFMDTNNIRRIDPSEYEG